MSLSVLLTVSVRDVECVGEGDGSCGRRGGGRYDGTAALDLVDCCCCSATSTATAPWLEGRLLHR